VEEEYEAAYEYDEIVAEEEVVVISEETEG
jgi:hypothetical protein